MFNSKKKRAERAALRFLTGSTLLRAALEGDKQTLAAIVSGQGTDDDALRYSLETFIMVAHSHQEILEVVREALTDVPPHYVPAFTSTIDAAVAGDPSRFVGVSVPAQGTAIAALAGAIVQADEEVLVDAMMMLEAGA